MPRKTRRVTITRDIDPGPYRSMEDIERANRDAGFYFFTPDTLRSFGSRIGETVYGGRFFTTSERSGFDYSSPRVYSVHIAMPDGSVETVGDFGQFTSSAQARRAAESMARSATGVRHDPYPGCEDPEPDPKHYQWRAWTTSPCLPIGTRDTKRNAERTARMLNSERKARVAK